MLPKPLRRIIYNPFFNNLMNFKHYFIIWSTSIFMKNWFVERNFHINILFRLFTSSILGRLARNKVGIKTSMLKLIWIYETGFIPKRIRKNKNRLLNAKASKKARVAFSHLKAQSHWLRQMRKQEYHNKAKSIQII